MSVVETLRHAMPSALEAYPDSEAPTIRRMLCERHGAEDSNLVVGNGGAAQAVFHPLSGLYLDLDALEADTCDAILLTNPHNPTGQLLPREPLMGLMGWIDAHPDLAVVLEKHSWTTTRTRH